MFQWGPFGFSGSLEVYTQLRLDIRAPNHDSYRCSAAGVPITGIVMVWSELPAIRASPKSGLAPENCRLTTEMAREIAHRERLGWWCELLLEPSKRVLQSKLDLPHWDLKSGDGTEVGRECRRRSNASGRPAKCRVISKIERFETKC